MKHTHIAYFCVLYILIFILCCDGVEMSLNTTSLVVLTQKDTCSPSQDMELMPRALSAEQRRQFLQRNKLKAKPNAYPVMGALRNVQRTTIYTRNQMHYRPELRKYPKGAVYTRYRMPPMYVTFKCPPKVGLLLCRASCERRSKFTIGSCDNGYCTCLLLKPGFRGKSVFVRRANCYLKADRVKCTKFCVYQFGRSAQGLCNADRCRCFTNPKISPKNQLTACEQARRRLAFLEARLRAIMRKHPSSRTLEERRFLQEVSKNPRVIQRINSSRRPRKPRGAASRRAPSPGSTNFQSIQRKAPNARNSAKKSPAKATKFVTDPKGPQFPRNKAQSAQKRVAVNQRRSGQSPGKGITGARQPPKISRNPPMNTRPNPGKGGPKAPSQKFRQRTPGKRQDGNAYGNNRNSQSNPPRKNGGAQSTKKGGQTPKLDPKRSDSPKIKQTSRKGGGPNGPAEGNNGGYNGGGRAPGNNGQNGGRNGGGRTPGNNGGPNGGSRAPGNNGQNGGRNGGGKTPGKNGYNVGPNGGGKSPGKPYSGAGNRPPGGGGGGNYPGAGNAAGYRNPQKEDSEEDDSEEESNNGRRNGGDNKPGNNGYNGGRNGGGRTPGQNGQNGGRNGGGTTPGKNGQYGGPNGGGKSPGKPYSGAGNRPAGGGGGGNYQGAGNGAGYRNQKEDSEEDDSREDDSRESGSYGGKKNNPYQTGPDRTNPRAPAPTPDSSNRTGNGKDGTGQNPYRTPSRPNSPSGKVPIDTNTGQTVPPNRVLEDPITGRKEVVPPDSEVVTNQKTGEQVVVPAGTQVTHDSKTGEPVIVPPDKQVDPLTGHTYLPNHTAPKPVITDEGACPQAQGNHEDPKVPPHNEYENHNRPPPAPVHQNQNEPQLDQYGRPIVPPRDEYQNQNGPQLDQYGRPIAPPRDEYQNQNGPQLDQYGRPIAPPRDEYQNQNGPRLDQYGRPIVPPRDEYQNQNGPQLDEYGRPIAPPRDEYQNQNGPRLDQYGRPIVPPRDDYPNRPQLDQYGRPIPPRYEGARDQRNGRYEEDENEYSEEDEDTAEDEPDIDPDQIDPRTLSPEDLAVWKQMKKEKDARLRAEAEEERRNQRYPNNNSGYQNNNAGYQNNNAGYQNNNQRHQNDDREYAGNEYGRQGDNRVVDNQGGYQRNNRDY